MLPASAPFPLARFRRTRRTAALRDLTQEVRLSVKDLIWPVFVRDGANLREPVASMPGVERLSVDLVVEAGLQAYDVQAPIAVIEAAGGIVTAWDGGPAHQGGRVLAASCPEVHQAAMAVLRG